MEREACEVLHGFILNCKCACVCVCVFHSGLAVIFTHHLALQGCASETDLNDDEELSWVLKSHNGAFKCSWDQTVPLINQLRTIDASPPPLFLL